MVIRDNLSIIAYMTNDIKHKESKKLNNYIESKLQAVIDAGLVPKVTQILKEYSGTPDGNFDILEPCVATIRNLTAGNATQIKTILDRKNVIVPSMLSILKTINENVENWSEKSYKEQHKIDSIQTDIFCTIGNIACHSDQIDFLLESKIMPAIIDIFGRSDNEDPVIGIYSAEAIQKFIYHGSFPQIVQILLGDDCIRYLFKILDHEAESDSYYEGYHRNPILIIIKIIRNLLIKHEKHRQLIKSTDDDRKKYGLMKYDLFEKIEHYDGIHIIKKLRTLNQPLWFKPKNRDEKKITKATTNLLNLYTKMKEKIDSEKKVEVVNREMKKVSVNSNQNGNKVLPRRMMLRSSKKRPLRL